MGFAGPTRVFCMCLLLVVLLLCSAPINSTCQSLKFVENGEMRSEMESGRRSLKVNIDDYSEPGANPGHDPLPTTNHANPHKLT